MLKKYLQILDESLDKKIEILTQVEKLSREQSDMIANEASFEEIDKNMDAKAELIEQINKMDDGFSAMYDNIKAELDKNRTEFKSEIATLKKKITTVMEKSTSIEAIEARNKAGMENRFSVVHKDNSERLGKASAVRDYYNVANKLNVITPQFLDSKK